MPITNSLRRAIMDKPLRSKRYRAVFISPHLDDAVFSCGGVIAQMVKAGPVLVLNLFTRYLSEVKIRGVVLGDERHQEEANAARFLGYESRNLGELDVSFRREAYKKLGNIFRPPIAEDLEWLSALRKKVFDELKGLEYQQIYVPLGIGWHVDHVLTHQLFEPWFGHHNLLFYEDAPYCCIPHSTRYRLNELADFARGPNDQSLSPINETRAWWQATMSYADTALMRNLQPWIVRKSAVPVVGFYLHRLMARHIKSPTGILPRARLNAQVVPIAEQFDRKVDAMSLYSSQFREFFSSRENCVSTLLSYANRSQGENLPVERYWMTG